jgi:hypothetical protein
MCPLIPHCQHTCRPFLQLSAGGAVFTCCTMSRGPAAAFAADPAWGPSSVSFRLQWGDAVPLPSLSLSRKCGCPPFVWSPRIFQQGPRAPSVRRLLQTSVVTRRWGGSWLSLAACKVAAGWWSQWRPFITQMMSCCVASGGTLGRQLPFQNSEQMRGPRRMFTCDRPRPQPGGGVRP